MTVFLAILASLTSFMVFLVLGAISRIATALEAISKFYVEYQKESE